MVRTYASQSVHLMFISHVESYPKISKNDIYSFPAWRSEKRDSVENKPESLLVVSPDKTLYEMSPSLHSKLMAKPSILHVVVEQSN